MKAQTQFAAIKSRLFFSCCCHCFSNIAFCSSPACIRSSALESFFPSALQNSCRVFFAFQQASNAGMARQSDMVVFNSEEWILKLKLLAIQNACKGTDEQFAWLLPFFHQDIRQAYVFVRRFEGKAAAPEEPTKDFFESVNARIVRVVQDFRGTAEQMHSVERQASALLLRIRTFLVSFMPNLIRGVMTVPKEVDRAVQAVDWRLSCPHCGLRV